MTNTLNARQVAPGGRFGVGRIATRTPSQGIVNASHDKLCQDCYRPARPGKAQIEARNVNASTSYKVRVRIEPREDGGLRVWSEDLPELVLSHADGERVIADIPRAMEVILSDRLGAAVHVEELADLPALDADARRSDPMSPTRALREFAARAA